VPDFLFERASLPSMTLTTTFPPHQRGWWGRERNGA